MFVYIHPLTVGGLQGEVLNAASTPGAGEGAPLHSGVLDFTPSDNLAAIFPTLRVVCVSLYDCAHAHAILMCDARAHVHTFAGAPARHTFPGNDFQENSWIPNLSRKFHAVIRLIRE
jgi:hypothetical protein